MRVLRFVEGLLLGSLAGTALVMLLTPRSGDATRQVIQERLEVIVSEGKQAAEERRLELQARFEELKRPA